ncbi:hypothetical protein PI124_g17394, partial [Phytophthora idaei]
MTASGAPSVLLSGYPLQWLTSSKTMSLSRPLASVPTSNDKT